MFTFIIIVGYIVSSSIASAVLNTIVEKYIDKNHNDPIANLITELIVYYATGVVVMLGFLCLAKIFL